MNIENNLQLEKSLPVDLTVYDLRRPIELNKKRLYTIPGGGYNNNFCISRPSIRSYRFHARYLYLIPLNFENFTKLYFNFSFKKEFYIQIREDF